MLQSRWILFCIVFATFATVGPSLAKASDFLSPVSVAASNDGKTLYIAHATAGQIAVFDIASGKVIKTISVGDKPLGIAISTDGTSLYVTSAVASGCLQIVDAARGAVIDTIETGHSPVAVTILPGGKRLYVCNKFDDNIGVIDLTEKKQIATIDVIRQPIGAAITPDGRFLFVANHLPAGAADGDYIAANVSVIDTEKNTLVKNIELPSGSTNLRGITISPDGKNVYVTHILGRYPIPVTLLESGWVNTNAMTVIDAVNQKFVNTVLVDDVSLGAADPHSVICTADGNTILITHSGSHELSVIDRKALHLRLLPARSARDFMSEISSTSGNKFGDDSYCANDIPNDLTFMRGIRQRIRIKGNGPRGFAFVGDKAYIGEYFTDSIGVIDIGEVEPQVKSIPLGKQIPLTKIRRGELFFNDSSLGFQMWHSCTSCHTSNGRVDGLNRDLLNDGIGNAKNTKSLLLAHSTPPAMITGIRSNAEVAVRSGIRYIQFNYPPDAYAQAIDEYLKSLEPIPSPYLVKGKLSKSARNGEAIFNKAGCGYCHPGPLYTDMKNHDVGTSSDEEYLELDTPTLIEVWRTAPYLHNGSAATIEEVLTKFNKNNQHGRTRGLTDKQIKELIEYILTR